MGDFVSPLAGHMDSALGGKKKMKKTKKVDGVEHPASHFTTVGDENDPSTWSGLKDSAKKKTAFADFNNQWVEIFRTGDYGDKGVWDENDLDDVVSNFSAWQPPAILGHVEENSPAMAWVKSVKREGEVLMAQFEKVQPELEAHADSGRFPNRSAAFYFDPQGGGPVLRHVAFLGATPPEVKGLAPIKFSDEKFVDFKFSEEETMDPKELAKAVKEEVRSFFSAMFGEKQPAAAASFTEAQVQERIAKAATDTEARLEAKFGERLKRAEDQAATTTVEAKRQKARSFVEKMKAANKWVPAFSEEGMDRVLEQLAVSGATVKFGEAGKETEVSCFDQMCAFLETQQAIVPTGDLVVKNRKGVSKVIKFNEARGVALDTSSIVMNERAEEIMAEEKISFGEALKKARREMPDGGAQPGGIAVGGRA